MPSTIHIAVHPSQFPDRVRSELLESLRTRRLNHKFLYDSPRQTRKWLALHQAYSPSRTDADCAATYDRSFEAVASRIQAGRVHLVGLGCGGGQKDCRLLRLLLQANHQAFYTPSDVSTSMVLVACQAAQAVLPPENLFPLVCDLALADDLAGELGKSETQATTRLFTFFGMIPNFEPRIILERLAGLVRPGDFLLFSANLAPGPDYEAGVKRILPLYDNALTRDWLFAFLVDLGIENGDGEMRFGIELDRGSGLRRISVHFHFSRARTIEVDDERFEFQVGESIRLFFSYRYTPQKVHELLGRYSLRVEDEWITKSEEEGVFLVKSTAQFE